MKNTNLTPMLRGKNLLIIAIFLLFSPLTGAYAACCAGHGGVASCNKSTGQQMCKDGSASPTCKCAIPKSTAKPVKPKPTPATNIKAKPTKPAALPMTTKPVKSIKATPTSGTSAKGCCSRHGGVAQCNKSTHYLMCKDGSASPSCTCQ